MIKFKKIAVLLGGVSAEKKVSLETGKYVAKSKAVLESGENRLQR